ncbi:MULTISPECIES: manganese efflux pump MntP [Sphingomonas]|uniref:Putative manganese efflux pump MntP n=1 Tax=Sphingomonas adhaesiva TaxID=28212 RepID=A0A2A4I557_9SPHN|nr:MULTISPECIES: manganese efflux pump MntP family protein [Sphingomonas]PCG14117.1 manganese efflux pump [Sphingomonas adhaesiva]PZU82125.1 MAG: manganese efflux pump [Sphingomonas sp.]
MPGIITLGALGASLSVDAFAAALGKGAQQQRARWSDALRVGLVFGVFEAATPAVGWLLGYLVNDWIADWDHWVSFGLLLAIGGHMIVQALKGDDPDAPAAVVPAPGEAPDYLRLSLTAIATSIDAAAVGVTLALMDVNVLVACIVIGATTSVVATAGVMLGKRVGAYLGHYATVAGGVVLIAVGSAILYQHLTA